MEAFTAELQLHTLFLLNDKGQIVSTREHGRGLGPRFALVRDASRCAWATRTDVGDAVAARVNELAGTEPPARDPRSEPIHAEQYMSLVGGRVVFGPAFTFPGAISHRGHVESIENISQLERHMRGWSADELPDCAPIVAVMEEGHAVSICFCARRSPVAAEAGVETAPEFRGRGLAARVTAAWALAVRATGRIPLYSTSWNNLASLAVARKLGLNACGSDWSLGD